MFHAEMPAEPLERDRGKCEEEQQQQHRKNIERSDKVFADNQLINYLNGMGLYINKIYSLCLSVSHSKGSNE